MGAPPAVAAAAAAAPPPPPTEHGLHTLPPFRLERFFARHEFSAPHLLCCSDAEPLPLAALLAAADADSAARWASLSLGYTQPQGDPALRAAIAERFYDRAAVGPGDVVVAAPQELLLLAVGALVRPGDHVVCTFPGYQSLYQLAEAAGAEVSRWRPRGGGGDGPLRFDVDDLVAALRPSTRLVVANFPHNPTGFLPPRAEWARALAAAAAAGARVLSDEMYRGLEADPAARLPPAADLCGRALSLGGLSKAAGLPGLRVGWVACRDSSVVRRMMELKDYTTICAPAPSEALALAAVRAWPALVDGGQAPRLRRNLRRVEAFFARWAAVFEWAPPAAGTVAFPRLLPAAWPPAAGGGAGGGESPSPVGAWCEALARDAGVLLLPADVYGCDRSVAQGRFRLGFGRADLDRCLAVLDAHLLAAGHVPVAVPP